MKHTHALVIAEQCLHSARVFPASHSGPLLSRLGVHKKLGGEIAGTADPTDQRATLCYMIAQQ